MDLHDEVGWVVVGIPGDVWAEQKKRYDNREGWRADAKVLKERMPRRLTHPDSLAPRKAGPATMIRSVADELERLCQRDGWKKTQIVKAEDLE